MKPAARVPLLVVLLLLPLFFLFGLASAESDELLARGRRGEERHHNPYHFGEESYRHWARARQGRFRVLDRFTERSELLRGIKNYRVAVLEAEPRTFLTPSHYDADELFYVMEGEGVVTLIREGRRQSHCVREGDVMVIPAGTIVYSANTHSTRRFRVAMLLNPISTPGRFEEYFPAGSEFSADVIDAAFNIPKEKWGRVFEKDGSHAFVTASDEQIRALSQSCSRGGGGSGEAPQGDMQPYSLTRRPCYSNNHGKLYEVTPEQCPQLRELDMVVGLANITRGCMMGPTYDSRATKIAIVAKGSGFFEIACPHLSGESEGRERGREGEQERKRRTYKQVKSDIREGSVVVMPPGQPTVVVAGREENLVVLFFGVRAAGDERVFLAGKNHVVKLMEDVAKELSFNTLAREVDEVIGAQPDAVFFRGPKRQGGGEAAM